VPPSKIRIGYVMGGYAEAARERRVNAVRSRADDSLELVFVQVEQSMELRDWTPEDTLNREASFVAGFRRAQAEGCQAVVPDGMLDLGVEAGRSAVRIPVVAPFEAAIHLAACVGARIGILQYTSGFVPSVWAKVRKYAAGEYVIAVAALDVEMVDLEGQRDAVGRKAVEVGRKLVAEHAIDVIIPTGPGLCPVTLDPAWLSAEIGVPIVEGIGAPIQVAATLVRLGLSQSPIRWPPSRGPG
jgi:allantoin racemase